MKTPLPYSILPLLLYFHLPFVLPVLHCFSPPIDYYFAPTDPHFTLLLGLFLHIIYCPPHPQLCPFHQLITLVVRHLPKPLPKFLLSLETHRNSNLMMEGCKLHLLEIQSILGRNHLHQWRFRVHLSALGFNCSIFRQSLSIVDQLFHNPQPPLLRLFEIQDLLLNPQAVQYPVELGLLFY